MSELLSNLCVARNDATGVVSINGEGRGLFPFDENSSLRWKITKIQECLVQVTFKNLGFCLAKLLFRWIDFLHKFFFSPKVLVKVLMALFESKLQPHTKAAVLNQSLTKKLFSENVVWKDCMVNWKKKNCETARLIA